MVVDASVAVKWAIDEIDRDLALQLLSADSRIVAPDLVISEVANVLRKKVKSGQLTDLQADEAISLVADAIEELLPASEIVRLALSLAAELDHSAYDCIYLACALHWGGTLVTADRKFHAKCQATNYAAIVMTADAWWSRIPLVDEAKLQGIERLADKIRLTQESLFAATSESFGEAGLRIVRSESLKPLFESPAYRHLSRELQSLTRDEVAGLVAIAWVGRGLGSTNWSTNFENASRLVSDGVQRHLPYIISLMRHVPAGSQRLDDLSGGSPSPESP